MAALDMQFTGLEFGTETFEFAASDVKPVMGNSLTNSSTSKDLSSLNASLSQPQSVRFFSVFCFWFVVPWCF